MRVLFVRHAEAVVAREAPNDAYRWLSRNGRSAMREMASILDDRGIRYTRILTSPLVRAVQTAEILASAEWFGGPVSVHVPLAPEVGTTAEALAPLSTFGKDETVVLVGHEPSIRVLAGHVLGLEQMQPFATGGCCLVRFEPGTKGQLEWMVAPNLGPTAFR